MKENNLFGGSLMDMLDSKDPLIILADNLPWSKIETDLQKYYTGIGRPPKPIRLMVGLLLLKQMENLSDEDAVLQWKRNPYYQYFCGINDYTPALPCHPTELVKFRNRIGKEGLEAVFGVSVALHGEAAEESQVIIDSTVHESNMTFPTDGKLAIKIVIHLLRIARRENIKLRRSFVKEIKELRILLRFFRHPKKIKKALGAMKRLREIAKIILRDIDRKFGEDPALHNRYAEAFYLYMRVLLQEKNTPNKIYSLHEIDAYAINKGKDHKGYEFGTKATVVMTKTSAVIVGVAAHQKNIHDSKTLDEAVANAHKHRNTPIDEAICDRGYPGVKEVSNFHAAHFVILLIFITIAILKKELLSYAFVKYVSELPMMYATEISIPGKVLKRDTAVQKEIKREKFRRRAAIEPVIGHLKSDHRMARNYLKGFKGDEINLLLAATAFNLKKWMRIYLHALFLQSTSLMFVFVSRIKTLMILENQYCDSKYNF